MLGDEFVRLGSKAFEERDDTRIGCRFAGEGGISESDASVADQAAPLGTFDGAAAKNCAEVLLGQGGEPFEFWSEECGVADFDFLFSVFRSIKTIRGFSCGI